MKSVLQSALILIAVLTVSPATANPVFEATFGFKSANSNVICVQPDDFYSIEKGFGFEPSAELMSSTHSTTGCLTSAKPFYFSIKLPEGNYLVRAVLGNPIAGSTNIIKAELRRLMLERDATQAGQFSTQTFVVNIRTPQIPGGTSVRLKERERTSEIWAWDEKLTLEFNGTAPAISSLTIESATNLPTLFLLGDSTVCDQPGEPWNSWGQMLTRFFQPTIAVANHAQSGETLKSSLGARRLGKVASLMRPGDFLMIQFGHNDMKDRSTNALAIYESNLKRFVSTAHEKGATPILITSMERKAGVDTDTLGNYPDTVRTVARDENVFLIDLHRISKQLYRALGSQLDDAFQDGTHHNAYGSYLLAKCIVRELKSGNSELARHLRTDIGSFDPSMPESSETFRIPASPGVPAEKPLGD